MTIVDELARARRVDDLQAPAVLPGQAGRNGAGRAAEPDLGFREFCRREKLPHSERSWDAWQGERHRRGEISQRSGYTENPFRMARTRW